MKFGISQSIPRKEDAALLRGAGRYVADALPPGTLHAVVLRSPHAHARLKIADTARARALPGVRLVLTARDAEVAALGLLPCTEAPPDVKVDVPPYPVLARDEVMHVGDAVAFVVADTLEHAKDAAEAIAVEYTPLPHVVDAVAALAPGAPAVWPHIGERSDAVLRTAIGERSDAVLRTAIGERSDAVLRTAMAGNVAFAMTLGDAGKTERAFVGAARTVELTVVNQRLVTNFMDTRAGLAEYDAQADRLTLTLGTQGVHMVRDMLAADILKIPPDKLRVITPDVGGGFGTKFFLYREYALIAVAARKLGRPVRWVADRTEHFLADAQGRDNVTTARLALNHDGKFLALAVETVCDMGAYLSTFAPYIPYVGAGMLPGVYDIPAVSIRITAAYTNTLPVDAYRGAGRPEASYVIERLVDTAARDLGVAPDAMRRKNFIKPRAMPYRTQTDKVYDTGEFAAHLARAQEIADWKGFSKRLAASKKANRLRGVGIATYIEACGTLGPETAVLRLEPDGGVTVLIGSQSSGQGHHTAYAQLVAEHLDIAPERVTVVQGDSDRIATGVGTGGSSSITCGGASVAGAARKLADNLKALASDALEAAARDLEIADGEVRVAGTDRIVTFAELARSPQASAEMLTTTDAAVPQAATYPNGTHLVEVEVDPDTGTVAIERYVVVDDFGVTLNPLLLAGQVHGGAVQGIGQALMERTVYDRSSGQLVTASLMDYALPRADDAPDFQFETRNVPTTANALGVKGAGEAGTVGSCPAVINAVVDALWRAFRIRHVDMPATPERVWAAIQEGKRLHTL